MRQSEQRRLFNTTSPADKKASRYFFYFNNVGKILRLTTANIVSKLLLSHFGNFYPSLKH